MQPKSPVPHQGTSTENPNQIELCDEVELSFSSRYYHETKQGFCPDEGWEDPVLWLKEDIPAKFIKLMIDFELSKEKEIDTANPHTFITALGKEIPIWKTWSPDDRDNNQIFRLSKNLDLNRKILSPTKSETMNAPVRLGDNNTFEIVRKQDTSTGAIYHFSHTYTSDKTGTTVSSDPFTENINLPSAQSIEFGIGTFRGYCVKPTRVEICAPDD